VGEVHQGIQGEGEWPSSNFNDFKVDIPEFEDKYEFLEWMQTVKRIFEHKEVPEEKKVKLVALKLRNMLLFGGPIC